MAQRMLTVLASAVVLARAEFLPLGIKEVDDEKEHHHHKDAKGFSMFKKDHHHHSHRPPWEHAHKMTPPSDLERKHREGMIPSVAEVREGSPNGWSQRGFTAAHATLN